MLQLTGDHTMDFMNLNPDPGNKMNAGSCGSGSTLTAFKYCTGTSEFLIENRTIQFRYSGRNELHSLIESW